MIKVIEHGDRVIKKCPTCKCVFTYENDDVQIKYLNRIATKIHIFVKCPECYEEIEIKYKR